ncbi:MAG TPA: hypothetical protein VH229_04955 [Candidatus Udaeobacter sp.]|nr:hypothetical protein [Candidatus Udaeobacter sp.]
MNRLSQICALAAALAALSGCGTVSDLVTSNLPETHSGRPSIIVSLREQEAYSTAEGIEPRRPAYRAAEKDTALRLAAFRSSVKTKIIAPVSMVTTLMTGAGS